MELSHRELVCVVQVDRSGSPVHVDVYDTLEGYLVRRALARDLGPFQGWTDVARALHRAERLTRADLTV